MVEVFPFRYDRWCGWLLGALGLGRRWSRVGVADDAVEVRMGWGFRAHVPRSNIVDAARTDAPGLGWGVHGWRGRWLVNGSLRGVVTVEIDPPVGARVAGVPVRLRTLALSLADPDGFLGAVR